MRFEGILGHKVHQTCPPTLGGTTHTRVNTMFNNRLEPLFDPLVGDLDAKRHKLNYLLRVTIVLLTTCKLLSEHGTELCGS